MIKAKEATAILAGLRMVQVYLSGTRPPGQAWGDVVMYHFDGDTANCLTVSEISELCERVNCGELNIVIHHHKHGPDLYPCWSVGEPDYDEQVAIVGDAYEPEKGEWLELAGPYPLSERREHV